jgi:hypothetical protein
MIYFYIFLRGHIPTFKGVLVNASIKGFSAKLGIFLLNFRTVRTFFLAMNMVSEHCC